jgi:hypothetical protein
MERGSGMRNELGTVLLCARELYQQLITRMIKSRKMRWAGHVARRGESGIHIGYWCDSQKERDHWEDQDVGE